MADDVVPQPSVLDSTAVDPQQAVDAVFTDSSPVSQPPVTPPVLPPQPLAPEPIEPPPVPTIVPPSVPPVPPATASVDPSPIPSVPTPPTTTTEELPLGLATPPPPHPLGDGTVPAPIPPKPKKGRKALAFLAGFIFLISGILGGGYYFLKNYFPTSPSTIANIQSNYPSPKECNGACDNGRLLKWDYGQDKCIDSGKACVGTVSHSVELDVSYDKCKEGEPKLSAWCDGCGGFCIAPVDKTCNQMAIEKCGEYPTYGANIVACDGKELTNCQTECGKCFDSVGLCKKTTVVGGKDVEIGLCGIVDLVSHNPAPSGTKNYYYCPGVFTDMPGGCSTPGKPPNLGCYCGTLQIDTGSGFESSIMKCGCGGTKPSKPPVLPSIPPSPSPSPSYSMSCTGLTKNVAAPIVGSKITFTCAGATVPPAGATLLKYDFRYNIDGGVWKTLTNKTKATAELTIAACGSYSVQCRACVTYGGQTTCDPIWQGATQ